jgi:hypothetical protein
MEISQMLAPSDGAQDHSGNYNNDEAEINKKKVMKELCGRVAA